MHPARLLIPCLTIVLLGLPGCGSTSDADQDAAPSEETGDAPSDGFFAGLTEPGADIEPVQFRRVLASDAAPCTGEGAGEGADCDLDPIDCDTPPETVDPDRPVGLCDLPPEPGAEPDTEDDGAAPPQQRYRLGPAEIVGGVEDASAAVPQNQVSYAVTFSLDAEGAERLATLSTELAGTQEQFAIVLEGRVLSAPTFASPVTGGQAQISGSFTQDEAEALATALTSGG